MQKLICNVCLKEMEKNDWFIILETDSENDDPIHVCEDCIGKVEEMFHVKNLCNNSPFMHR